MSELLALGAPLVLSEVELRVVRADNCLGRGGWHIDDVNIDDLKQWDFYLCCLITPIHLFSPFSICTSPSAEALISLKQAGESDVKRVGSGVAGEILFRLWLNPNAGLPDKCCVYISNRSL